MKSKTQKPINPNLRIHTRGFPIWIRDGKLIEPEAQVVEFLTCMFAYVEASEETPLQATMEVKISTERR
jgi:hypothetical protein